MYTRLASRALHDRTKYEGAFRGPLGAGSRGYVTRDEAHKFLARSRLPVESIDHILTLADVNSAGVLTAAEFNAAMHLVTLRRAGTPLPSTLPPELRNTLPLSSAALAAAPTVWDSDPAVAAKAAFQ